MSSKSARQPGPIVPDVLSPPLKTFDNDQHRRRRNFSVMASREAV